MRIREAASLDAEAISRLVSDLAREFIVDEYTQEGRERMLAGMTPAAVAANLEAGFDMLVAEDEGRLVGVVMTRDDTHLYHLFVARDWHRRGVARRLWERARDRCVERSGTRRFTVNASTYAREAYARLGFRPVLTAGSSVHEREGIIWHPMELVLEPQS